jgi:hypothetical protein
MTRVVVVGATRNFFKVGHTTLRTLARTNPDVQLRLGIPDVTDARLACAGIDMEFVPWDPADPGSLDPVLEGCDSLLMVPPIDRRIEAARVYIAAARRSGIGYILCLGVQYTSTGLTLAVEAEAVASMLAASGITHDTLRLPMFLENLLYQIPSISAAREFRFPVSPDAPFSFVTCGDLGQVFAPLLNNPPHGSLGRPYWTATERLTCAEWADLLSQATGRTTTFRPQCRDKFIDALIGKGMSRHAAHGICQLWDAIERGEEPPPSDALIDRLGRQPETAAQWTADHSCCFSGVTRGACPHPRPPAEHMF